jgi:glycosyltransferase involved in cell wall biosynthesis
MEQKNKVSFSIVTVCYNTISSIEDTIKSVLGQSYKHIEYIIIDGGSTDGTVDLIKKYEYCVSFWTSEPDKGIYDAMNKGIMYASNDYILFLNAGDFFYDEKTLENVAARINSNVDVVFGDVAIVMNGVTYQVPSEPFYEHLPLHHSMGFNHQCTFVKTDVAKRFLFDLKYKLAADYNMIISIYRMGRTFQQLHNLVISCYDMSGVSEKNRRLHIFETLMVDTPNRVMYNRLKSYICYMKLLVGQKVGVFLYRLFPNWMKQRRSKRMTLLHL